MRRSRIKLIEELRLSWATIEFCRLAGNKAAYGLYKVILGKGAGQKKAREGSCRRLETETAGVPAFSKKWANTCVHNKDLASYIVAEHVLDR